VPSPVCSLSIRCSPRISWYAALELAERLTLCFLLCPLQPIVSTVEGSFSSAGSGGGIHGTQCGFRLTNSKLRGNTAAANGGGAALQLCQAVLEQSTVENNEVGWHVLHAKVLLVVPHVWALVVQLCQAVLDQSTVENNEVGWHVCTAR
jgi:hypothetical protein